MVAIGRTPNGKMIDAQVAGVEVDERGFIRTDKQMRTNVPPYFLLLVILSRSANARSQRCA